MELARNDWPPLLGCDFALNPIVNVQVMVHNYNVNGFKMVCCLQTHTLIGMSIDK